MNAIEFAMTLLTGVTATVLLIIVAGPMTHRPRLEKWLLFTLAMGSIGAFLFRLGSFTYGDPDGSVRTLSASIVIISKFMTIVIGSVWMFVWIVRCHKRKARVSRIGRGCVYCNSKTCCHVDESGYTVCRQCYHHQTLTL